LKGIAQFGHEGIAELLKVDQNIALNKDLVFFLLLTASEHDPYAMASSYLHHQRFFDNLQSIKILRFLMPDETNLTICALT
jgi:Na+-translocating ferredoxin:NAD+ oxidoreductase RnfC subunit